MKFVAAMLKVFVWIFLLLGIASAFMTTVADVAGAETASQQGTAISLALLLGALACILGRRKVLARLHQSAA